MGSTIHDPEDISFQAFGHWNTDWTKDHWCVEDSLGHKSLATQRHALALNERCLSQRATSSPLKLLKSQKSGLWFKQVLNPFAKKMISLLEGT